MLSAKKSLIRPSGIGDMTRTLSTPRRTRGVDLMVLKPSPQVKAHAFRRIAPATGYGILKRL
jgi:hypothetical protein